MKSNKPKHHKLQIQANAILNNVQIQSFLNIAKSKKPEIQSNINPQKLQIRPILIIETSDTSESKFQELQFTQNLTPPTLRTNIFLHMLKR